MLFNSLREVFFILSLSPEVVIIDIKFINALLKHLSIALFLSKFSLNGSEILISDTLKVLASEKVVEKKIINRKYEIKNIYIFFNLNNLFFICIIYTNEKTKIYL
tara:strand:- start:246 stop:560 length:315 start_codon:yes stop_codon:yes gene_type:complete